MATYNTLIRGSTGADLKKLQQSLMDNDYKTDPTRPRVSGALKNAASGELPKAVETVPEVNQTHKTTPLPAPTQQEDTPVQKAPATYDPTTDKAYQSALSKLLQVQKSVPTYKDSFSSQLQDAYDKIVNREKFSYDVNADAMYQQMKDQYIAGGKLAMADTMGQAAALNGGYGSSYAQSVGQQAYQGYMQQLNDIIPELYDRSLAQYNQEGQDMLTQYAMLSDMADDEYAKYQDSLNRYYTDLQMAKSDVDTAYNRGYGAYSDSLMSKYATAANGGYKFDVDDWIAINNQMYDYAKMGEEALAGFLDGLEFYGVVDPTWVDAMLDYYFPKKKYGMVDTTVDLVNKPTPSGRPSYGIGAVKQILK